MNGEVDQEGTDKQQTEGKTDSPSEEKAQETQETDTDQGEQNQTGEKSEDTSASGNTEQEEDSSQVSGEIHPTYTIQRGDTITKISIKTYGSTEKVREICELNNLSVNDLIYPGQKILLP